jgi:hypothetical protein
MSEIKVDTLTGKTTANDITVTVGATATMSLEQGLAKCWAEYNTQTSTTLTESLSVSSLTDNATGDTTVTTSITFSGATGQIWGGFAVDNLSTNKHQAHMSYCRHGSNPRTTTSARFSQNFDGSGTTLQDMKFCTVSAHGDLA